MALDQPETGRDIEAEIFAILDLYSRDAVFQAMNDVYFPNQKLAEEQASPVQATMKRFSLGADYDAVLQGIKHLKNNGMTLLSVALVSNLHTHKDQLDGSPKERKTRGDMIRTEIEAERLLGLALNRLPLLSLAEREQIIAIIANKRSGQLLLTPTERSSQTIPKTIRSTGGIPYLVKININTSEGPTYWETTRLITDEIHQHVTNWPPLADYDLVVRWVPER